MWLTDAELADYQRDLAAISAPRLANAPGDGRRRRMLYTVMLPAPEDPGLGGASGTREGEPVTPTEPEAAQDERQRTARWPWSSWPGRGQFDEIRELFTPGLRPMVTADGLQAAWEAELAERGQLTAVGDPASDPGRWRHDHRAASR